MPLRQIDALWRVGMARQDVEAGVGRTAHRAEIGVGRHGLQEAPSRIGVETRLPAGLDANGVRLQLLIARELRQPELAANQRHIRARVCAEHVGHHLGGKHLLGFLLLALQAVIGRDMPHLMGNHGGKLG